MEKTAEIIPSNQKESAQPFEKQRPELSPSQEKEESQQIRAVSQELRGAIPSSRSDVVERIKSRNHEEISGNAARILGALEEQFIAENTINLPDSLWAKISTKIFPSHGSKEKLIKAFKDKTQRFENVYEQTIFSDVRHSTKTVLGEQVELKSPRLQVNENGKSPLDASSQSSHIDEEIGNTDYVFACFSNLPSRSFLKSGNHYKITSQDAFVVPLDYVDMRHLPDAIPLKPQDETYLSMYADNIQTLPDFKKAFSAYSATFFDSPEDSIKFFQKYTESKDIERTDFWDLKWCFAWNGQMNEEEKAKDKRVLEKMRELLVRKQIFPPFAPELQYKNSVSAFLIEPN